jgi:hypothetical protein
MSGNRYKYFIVLNSSLRGPFLPLSWPKSHLHWSEIFTSKLSDDIKLVGLSINCPDGVGMSALDEANHDLLKSS